MFHLLLPLLPTKLSLHGRSMHAANEEGERTAPKNHMQKHSPNTACLPASRLKTAPCDQTPITASYADQISMFVGIVIYVTLNPNTNKCTSAAQKKKSMAHFQARQNETATRRKYMFHKVHWQYLQVKLASTLRVLHGFSIGYRQNVETKWEKFVTMLPKKRTR